MQQIPKTLNEKQLCEVLGISPKTAQAWRHNGRGPSWYRLGPRLVRYREEDVVAFLEGGRVEALPGRKEVA